MAIIGISQQEIGFTQESIFGNNKPQDESQLSRIKARGYLNCGVSGTLPGFSYVDQNGKYAGLDVDICRAVAAALFDDPDKVKFLRLNAAERFDVLERGQIDLLSRNTTQTFSRDTKGKFEFTPPTFYDAQGIMVHQDSGTKRIENLTNKSICVTENTTSFDNLKDYMQAESIKYTPLVSQDSDFLYRSYEHNDCQAITGDISQLVARKTLFANPQNHVILSTTISQEPLAPALLHQDSQWFDVVKWVTYTLIQAEELDIDSENISIYKDTKDLEIRRFLGTDGNLGSQMGLSNDFAARIIKHVGNYSEIYERNIAQPFGLARGQNALWKDGGLMYSPPFK